MLLTPIIWAEPGPEVAQGKPVSIWCQGSQHADQYFLYREGVSEPLRREFPMGPSNKAKFPFPHMTYNLAGRYFCLYHRRTRRSVPSKPLDLAVTGERALPSAQVRWGCPRRDLPFYSSVPLTIRGWCSSLPLFYYGKALITRSTFFSDS